MVNAYTYTQEDESPLFYLSILDVQHLSFPLDKSNVRVLPNVYSIHPDNVRIFDSPRLTHKPLPAVKYLTRAHKLGLNKLVSCVSRAGRSWEAAFSELGISNKLGKPKLLQEFAAKLPVSIPHKLTLILDKK